MTKNPSRLILALLLGVTLSSPRARAAELPKEWSHVNEIHVERAGLIRLNVPDATLDAAQASFQDVRLLDAKGHDYSFFLDRPVLEGAVLKAVGDFESVIENSRIVITIRTGIQESIDTLIVETPARDFIKSISVEGKGEGWRMLSHNRPIFRQENDAENLQVRLPKGVFKSLRLTVDDARSRPIPITGIKVRLSPKTEIPTESRPISIEGMSENAGSSRLTGRLDSRNLYVKELKLMVEDPVFTRHVEVSSRYYEDGQVREKHLASATIFRIPPHGGDGSLTIPVGAQIPSRELVIRIEDGDSPPLRIDDVTAITVPVSLVFFTPEPGGFSLLTGNRTATKLKHDLSDLKGRLNKAAPGTAVLSKLAKNPDYSPPEFLPMLDELGTKIDVTDWKYRTAVRLRDGEIHRLTMGLHVLAQGTPDGRDLRLVHSERQIPYILDQTGYSKTIEPTVTEISDKDEGSHSVWSIQLPYENLPIQSLSCRTTARLFERTATVYAEVRDERGRKTRRRIGGTTWVRRPSSKGDRLSVGLDSTPRARTLILEIDNKDNPPISLDDFSIRYTTRRILFKTKLRKDIWLYYGNKKAAAPRYDISLVAQEILDAPKSDAELVEETTPAPPGWLDTEARPLALRILFWAVLAGVVVGLLLVIKKLLPPGKD